MTIQWSQRSRSDLRRLQAFISTYADDPSTADAIVTSINQATRRLLDHPRIGSRVERASFRNREVRRLLVGSYEIIYEVSLSTIYILRVRHTRELR